METVIWKIDTPSADLEVISKAAEIINSGGLVAFPTETVYGLGANALNGTAVSNIFAAKGRPQDNPLIAHVTDASALEALCSDIPPSAYILCEKFWPGPLSLILKSSGAVAPEVSCGLDTVAVRAPDNQIAQALLKASGVPIAAPSANISGSPSPTEASHVYGDLHGKVAAILDGGPCSVGVESTVLDLVCSPPRILRPGDITLAQIRTVCPDAIYDEAVFKTASPTGKVRSPGMKYRHYSPNTKVVILHGSAAAAAEYVKNISSNYNSLAVLCYEEEVPLFGSSAYSYGPENRHDILAKNLYTALRKLDQVGADIIFARCPENSDSAAAVVNRLMRAAGHNIIEV